MMQNVGQTLFRFILCGSLAFIFSCQKSNRLHSSQRQKDLQGPVLIEDDLTPTSVFEDTDGPIVRNGVTYQAPEKKIRNAQAELLMGRVKFDKSKFVYDMTTGHLRITGFIRVLDENKKEIGATDFDISGSHQPDENKILLKETGNQKINSTQKPLVRAKVTCLSINDDDEYDCSRSVIDFFISYKKQKYTEQMELAQKAKQPEVTPTTPTSPIKPPPTRPSTGEATEDETDSDGLQQEGIEDSIDGRYQGQAETADLRIIFVGDEDDDDEPLVVAIPVTTATEDTETTVTEVKPSPAAKNPIVIPPTTTPATAKATTTPAVSPAQPPTTTPAAVPAAEVKSSSTVGETPKPVAETPQTKTPVAEEKTKAPPAEVKTSSNENKTPAQPAANAVSEKQEKQLSKDWQQLKNGDVRQINQALGFPNDGKLRNATSVLTKQQTLGSNSFFEVVSPGRNRHFATYEMAELITRMGKVLSSIYNHKLFVGNISQQNGGKISPHRSHQIGVDADMGYPTTNKAVKFPVVVQMKTRKYNPSSYSVEKTYELLKHTFSQPDIKIDRIFMDRTIKKALCDYAKSQNEFNSNDKALVNTIFNNIDHVDGHGDHFHIRLKCSSYDPGCRQKIYAVNKGCN